MCVLGGELGIKANVNYFFLKTLILCLTPKLPCYESALGREFGDARLCSMCDHTALMSQSVCNTGEPLPSILPCLASHPDLLVWGAGTPGLFWAVPVEWGSDQPDHLPCGPLPPAVTGCPATFCHSLKSVPLDKAPQETFGHAR